MSTKILVIAMSVFCFLFGTQNAMAQSTFVISAADQSVASSGGQASFSLDFSIQQTTGTIEETRGFSFSCGHDDTLLAVTSSGTGPYVPGTLGPITALNGGTGPDFIQGEIFPNGFTCGVIYAFTAQNQTITYEIAKPVISADYETLPGALTGVTGDLLTQISQGSGLGSPPTATVVVIGSGESAPASVETCSVTIQAAPPIVFNCQVEDSAASFNGSSGTGSATVGLSISEDIAAGGSANLTQGFSLGLSYDGQVIDATGVTQGASLSALESGAGAEFFNVSLLAGGLTVGCIYDFQGVSFIDFGLPEEVLSIDFDTVAGTLAGSAPSSVTETTLTPIEGLGPTGVTLVMVVDGTSIPMNGLSGVLSLTALGGFDRGDCNVDGTLDLADVIKLLGGLFSGDTLLCNDACDGNDDEVMDIADAIVLLGVLFSGDPAPPGSGSCAPDPTEGALTCDSFPVCE